MSFSGLWNRLWNWWFTVPEFLRFLLVGAYNTLFSYVLFSLFYAWLQGYLQALTYSNMLSILNNFLCFRYFVFRQKNPWLISLGKTYISYLGIYLLNLCLLWIFSDILRISPYLGQFLCSLILPVITYLLLKYFSYATKN